MEQLNPRQVEDVLRLLHVAWSAIPGEGLVRVWEQTGFRKGFALAAKLSDIIGMYDSKPALLVTGDMVQLVLTAPGGGISPKEVALAEAIDKLLH